jgi:hypothetical protein
MSDRYLPGNKKKRKDDLESIDNVNDGNGRLANSNVSNN